MLHDFLLTERSNILALCAEKVRQLSESKSTSDEMERGLPVFYDELIEVLRVDELESQSSVDDLTGSVHRDSAMRRGRESLRLGYTIFQVVHGYGALCQAITEFAALQSYEKITSREFNRLNFCLDIAIAEAVTEFNKGHRITQDQEAAQRLGFFAHEMRNALANAALAYQAIKRGFVGVGGSTGQILEDSLIRLKDIIDRSLSEVRLRGEPIVDRQRCHIVSLVSKVEATAVAEASAKSIHLHVDIDPDLIVLADDHLVISAVSNLVQNAIKFTPKGGNVYIRGRAVRDQVVIEVQDECGGLPPGKVDELFQPFTQRGEDRSGVGLGLSICRRAIALNDGTVSASDLPGRGCIFTIALPRFVANDIDPEERSQSGSGIIDTLLLCPPGL